MAAKFSANLRSDDVKEQHSKPLFTGNTSGTLGIEELVLEGRREIGGYEGVKDVSRVMSEIPSSEVTVFLKGRIGNLTVEGTINAMYMIIKNMEKQLTSVNDINASLKKDLKAARENEDKACKENDAIKTKLRAIEETMPLKEDIERKYQQVLAELNKNKEMIQDLTKEKQALELETNHIRQEMVKLEEEKNDTLKYASSFESKVNAMVEMISDYKELINSLQNDNACMESDLAALENEKSVIEFELKEAKDAFEEIYSELAGVKSKTKNYFRDSK